MYFTRMHVSGSVEPPENMSMRRQNSTKQGTHTHTRTGTQTYPQTGLLVCVGVCVCVSAPKNFFGCQSMEAEKQRARVTHTRTEGAVCVSVFTTVTARHPV